jgi:large subunit ribosomal protein L15
MMLNTINKRTVKKSKRLGRGIGSSKGKTSGRGHKGQKSRSGVAIKSFEGGQMPLYRRLPKRGFKSFNKNYLIGTINLSQIQDFVDKKKLSSTNLVNLVSLKKNHLINKRYDKLKLLGTGDVKFKLQIEVNAISKSAKIKIEKNGGVVNILNHKKK